MKNSNDYLSFTSMATVFFIDGQNYLLRYLTLNNAMTIFRYLVSKSQLQAKEQCNVELLKRKKHELKLVRRIAHGSLWMTSQFYVDTIPLHGL